MLGLFAVLMACSGSGSVDEAPQDGADTGTTPDTASSSAGDVAAGIREVFYVASVLPTNMGYQPVAFILTYGGRASSCPSVGETEAGEWDIVGDGCVERGSGAQYQGSIHASGVTPGDSGWPDPGPASAAWAGFSTSVDVPDSEHLYEEVDGQASFEITPDGLGSGRFDLTVHEEGYGAEQVAAGSPDSRTWELDQLSVSNLWALADGGTDEVDGVVRVVDVGATSISGTITWDPACSTEPAAGSLTLTSDVTVTLEFDGAIHCDGTTPYDGDVSGNVSWSG